MKKHLIFFLVILSKVIILSLYPSVISDVGYYFEQSRKLLSGLLPYIDFKFEYPPLAVIPLWLPGILTKSLSTLNYDNYLKYYRFLLFTLDLGFIVYLKYRFEQKSFYTKVMITNAFVSLALGPLLYDRLDLIFGMILFGCLISIYDGKKMQGLGFAVLGVPFKLISLIFIPFIGVSFLKDSDFNVRKFLKIVGVPSLIFLILLLAIFKLSFLDFLAYHHVRGIQIESSWASLEFLFNQLSGQALHLEYNFGAQHLKDVSPLLVVLANYSVLVVMGLLFFMFVFFNIGLNQMLLTSLVAFITFGKVLSPQFLIWFLPLIIFFEESVIEMYFFGALCLLTAPIIFNYGDLINQQPWTWWCVAARNLILISWTALRFRNLLQLNRIHLFWKKTSPAEAVL